MLAIELSGLLIRLVVKNAAIDAGLTDKQATDLY